MRNQTEFTVATALQVAESHAIFNTNCKAAITSLKEFTFTAASEWISQEDLEIVSKALTVLEQIKQKSNFELKQLVDKMVYEKLKEEILKS